LDDGNGESTYSRPKKMDVGGNASTPKKEWAGGSQGCKKPGQSGYGFNPIPVKTRRVANDSETVLTLSVLVRNCTLEFPVVVAEK
jgi:hypothetical protein